MSIELALGALILLLAIASVVLAGVEEVGHERVAAGLAGAGKSVALEALPADCAVLLSAADQHWALTKAQSEDFDVTCAILDGRGAETGALCVYPRPSGSRASEVAKARGLQVHFADRSVTRSLW